MTTCRLSHARRILRRAWASLASSAPLLGVIAVVLATVAAADARAEPNLRAIRLGVDRGMTRIVLESDQPLRVDLSTSTSPERLTIDLGRVMFTLPASARPTGMVRQIYFGHSGPSTSRVIADISGPFRVHQVLRIPPEVGVGHRLVVDLLPRPPIAPTPPPAPPAEIAAAPSEPGTPIPPPSLNPRRDRPPVIAQNEAPAPPQELPPVGPSTTAPPQPAAGPPAEETVERRETRPMIVVDAGHGGRDPGAIGQENKTLEKDVTLKTALLLAKKLGATGRYRVLLTREDDTFVPLRERLHKARAVRGDLFVSLHADSLEDRSEHGGATVYTLSQTASDAESQRIATGENAADDLADSSYQQYDSDVVAALIDLAMRDSGVRSEKVATRMVESLGAVTPMVGQSLRSAGFVVLMSPDMPSVLIEMGYLSNARDELRLRSDEHIEEMTTAMVRAINHARDANLLLTH